MKIPKEIKVGRKWYAVRVLPRAPGPYRGLVRYDRQEIHVYKSGLYGARRTPRQRGETFWHEMTHAILEDMGSSLERNERFVTAFSSRLNSAIHSARF